MDIRAMYLILVIGAIMGIILFIIGYLKHKEKKHFYKNKGKELDVDKLLMYIMIFFIIALVLIAILLFVIAGPKF